MQLFLRRRSGMQVTDHGADLVPVAADMVANATQFGRVAAGLDNAVDGTLRISVNDILGIAIMPRILAAFQQTHPEIAVELDISNTASNLLSRDADIAVRMFRPVQNDLVARKIASLPLGFFWHEDYFATAGRPASAADLTDHRLIGFDRDSALIAAAKAFGLDLTPANFAFRCDTILAQTEAIRAGAGIGITRIGMAAKWAGVTQVLAEVTLPPLPLWLACHADVRHNKRVRLGVDFLADQLRDPYAGYRG